VFCERGESHKRPAQTDGHQSDGEEGFPLKVGNENLCQTENDLHVRARVFCLIVACPHIITTPLPWIGLPFEDN